MPLGNVYTYAEEAANPDIFITQDSDGNTLEQPQSDEINDDQPATQSLPSEDLQSSTGQNQVNETITQQENINALKEKKEIVKKNIVKPNLIVKYKNSAKVDKVINNANKALEKKHKGKDITINVKKERKTLKMAEITIGPDISIKEAKAELEKDPDVEYVQPNYQMQSFEAPLEPDIDKQWALAEGDQNGSYNLNIGDNWTVINSMEPVTVGVIDTGIDVNHDELIGKIIDGWDFYNDDETVFDEGDASHGTQIVGIISANLDGQGIAGLAAKAQIMPLKFIENGIGYTSDAIDAIEYAKSHGVNILNCSWGSQEYNQALKDAIEQNPDILFICAAGNTGDSTKIYPAAYQLSNVIAVASVNQLGELALTSSYGSQVAIAAPGEEIYSTSADNNYTYGNGTSLAAGYVTAAAAIYQGLKPDASRQEIALAIKESAVMTDNLKNKVTGGLLSITPLLENTNTTIPENPEEDFSYLPSEVIEILNTKNKYSELNEEEKTLIQFTLSLDEKVLITCEKAGLTLKQSIFKAQIMQNLNLTLEEAKAAGLAFESEKTAAEQAGVLANYLAKFESLSDDKPQVIDLYKQGFPARNIVNAYIVSKALDLEMGSIIAKEGSAVDLSSFSSEEQNLIQALAISYTVKEEAIIGYMQRTSMSVQEIEELITKKQEELKIVFEDEQKALTSDEDAVAPIPNAPFQYRTGISEKVNLNSGALSYEEALAKLPGKNGLDLNLGLAYNSAESYSGNDQKAKLPQKYMGRGWALNFTRVLYRSDGQYVRFTDGSTYPLVYENSTYKLGNYKLDDIKVTLTTGIITGLSYGDGRKETFDSGGNISSITDRFGNTITFSTKSVGTVNKEVSIIDSVGETTRILCNFELTCNFYNIILPDKSKIALYLDSNGSLIRKVDQNGRITTYTYESVNGTYNGESRNYQDLSTVTYPTGLLSKYEYETADGGIATYYRIKNMYKKAGKHIYLNDQYYYSASYLNASSDYTTTVTNAIGTQTSHCFSSSSHLKKKETVTAASKTRKTIDYEYTTTELPKKITTQSFGLDSSIGKIVCKQYTYDNNGNILTYTSPLAKGYQNSEYETKYTYDSSYNLIKTKEYKKDAKTTIKQVNDLTSDRKAIKETRITENGTLKKRQCFEYDDFGNLLTLKDYIDQDDFIETTYTYENDAYLETKTVGGATTEYSYDDVGRVISSTDPNGHTTQYEYDPLGRITRTVFPDNTSKELTYNDNENIIIFKNENGNQTKFVFDELGNIAEIIDQSTQSVLSTYKYDDLLRTSQKTDGNGNKTEYAYDYANRVLSKTVGSYQEKYEYKDCHRLNLSREIKTVIGDKNAPTITTFQDKDLQDNIVKRGFLDRSLEYATTYEYDYTGNITTELSAKDKEQGYTYTSKYATDFSGNVLSKTSDSDVTTEFAYDFLGRKISSTDPMGNTTNFTYDDLNRLIKEEIPLINNEYSTKYYEYDSKGNMAKQSISSNSPGEAQVYRDTEFEYDERDRLIKVASNDDGQDYYTEYDYDGVGNLTSMATGNGANITSYTYNSLGQVTMQTDPLGNSETYKYDLNNNLVSKTDRNQNRLVNTYNALNRLLTCTVTQPDGKTLSQQFSYAPNGAMVKEENENISVSLRYDNMGRVISHEDSNGITQDYTYDLAGNRISYKLKNNGQNEIVLDYSYDKLNHLTQVKESGTLRATYSYDSNGNRREAQFDNGIKTEFQYNDANLITEMSNKLGSNTLSSYAYTYYLDGNQKSKTDHLGKTSSYEYDDLGRLTKETEDSTTTEYSYDLSSNRIKKCITGETSIEIDYTYDANDRLTWEETQKDNDVLATTEYFYDANGNQISKLFNDLTDQSGEAAGISLESEANTPCYEQYEYDGFNRLIGYYNPVTTAKYTYNPEGLRISKDVNGQATQHIWDGANMVMELDDSGQIIDKYIRGNGLIKSELNGYYLHNAHGDVIQLADQQGAVTRNYLYDAFGEEKDAQTNDHNPFRYCGEYLDNESGNVYLRARYYDPATSRMISKDSYEGNIKNPLSLNLYIYCANDPVNNIDPSGHWAVAVAIARVASAIKSAISSSKSSSKSGESSKKTSSNTTVSSITSAITKFASSVSQSRLGSNSSSSSSTNSNTVGFIQASCSDYFGSGQWDAFGKGWDSIGPGWNNAWKLFGETWNDPNTKDAAIKTGVAVITVNASALAGSLGAGTAAGYGGEIKFVGQYVLAQGKVFVYTNAIQLTHGTEVAIDIFGIDPKPDTLEGAVVQVAPDLYQVLQSQ